MKIIEIKKSFFGNKINKLISMSDKISLNLFNKISLFLSAVSGILTINIEYFPQYTNC